MILLVAATEAELCGHPGLVCGVGPVEAAIATARALAVDPPRGVLHVGVAGATGLDPGALVVGTEAVYADISAAIPVVSRVQPEATLLAAVRQVLPEALTLPIATSATVGGLRGSEPQSPLPLPGAARATIGRPCGSELQSPAVEAMEGFAVLRACALAGVPAVEVRAIANELGEEDRTLWEIPRALGALGNAVPRLLEALVKERSAP